ncbi:putative integral membrane protein [Babesia bovis T2Bo]|uniref:putative integral membrane protein n=1 Tax=Babesia bovis T2Bo TaxID=484906 RepID=UPI001D2D7F03|nr:putative integral membrane protein [Babesia bovis T2Bo]KAG6439973.1 putative integral membrane protein [Babesia bovis T2Bo]
MSARLDHSDGRKITSQQRLQEASSDDVFLLDLEGKIDTLKSVSTDIHSELKNSNSRIDGVRGGLDEAHTYVKQGFDNMSHIMDNKTGVLSMTKMVLLTATILSVIYIVIKLAIKRKQL